MVNLEIWQLLLLLFIPLLVFLALGQPIGFTLGGIAVFLTLLLMGPQALNMIVNTAISETSSFILLAVPLFVFMGNLLFLTRIADDLYDVAYKWLGRLPGGLAIGTVAICAIFAAMTGLSGVATVSMGLIALPSMLKRGYNKNMAVGCIAAGGALGILIPPSVIMIIYGSLCDESVGQLFMGGMIPGIILALIFIGYIAIRCLINPQLGPPDKRTFSFKEGLRSLKAVTMPLLLILLVLGVIYMGVCTPTEAAGVGAFGAILCGLIQRRLSWRTINKALLDTLKISGMIFWIIIGAVSFSHIYGITGVTKWLTDIIVSIGLNRWIIIIIMQLIWFIMGCFLDPMGILLICAPVFVPIILSLGFDKLWFGVLFTINMEMAYITPPFGFNLFYMKGVVPPEISMGDIYRSIVPYVFCQALCLALVMVFPELALWLPRTMMTR